MAGFARLGLVLLAVLLVGCSITMPTAVPTPVPPTPTAKPTPTPALQPTAPSTATVVTGWPTVSQDGITMTDTGTDMQGYTLDGRLQLSVGVTGLTPGEAVVISSAGAYQMGWACGVGPEPCIPTSAFSCAFTSRDTTEGTAEATTRDIAGSDGVATLMVDLLAAPPAGSCPTDPASPWQTHSACWEPVTVTDAAHGLRLTPGAICTGP